MIGIVKSYKRRAIRLVCITRPQSLWKRYVLALAIVFLTISAAHYSSIVAIGGADADAEASQISNRQVMLSQRILFLIRESERGAAPEIDARLRSAIQLYEDSHHWLISHTELSPQLHHIYFDNAAFPLDHFSRRFVEIARYMLEAEGQVKTNMQSQLVRLGQQDLLAALSRAAHLHEARAEAQNTWLQQLQTLALTAALVVLVLEALFIFLPAQVSVTRTIRRLERRNRQVASSFEALRQRNSDLVAARNNLAHAANHDALTGLLNRRALYDSLTGLEQPGGAEVSVGIVKLDLDRFKAINDSLGHKAGDDVLINVARLLLQHSRPHDLVARIGGDEFVIVVKAPQSVAHLETLGQRLVVAISQPMMIEGTASEIGTSVGFTLATSTEATPDQMLIEADLALYQAKRNGRGQVFAFSSDLRKDFNERRMLFAQIDAALNDDQFEPHFQPQICAGTGALHGCEVLARWRHPERGIIHPATFIAAAEDAGLIRQIDLMMVEKGLDALEDLRARGYSVPSISINAAPATLRDPNLPDRLLQEIHARGMVPGDLTVEILENTLIHSEDDYAIRSVDQLTEAGFSVVLDDFGTGYASMSNLSRLKINGIKLDRSLIAPMPNERSESIVAALVALSRSLDMKIVAEGVETKAQADRVKALGCDVIQGFLLGHTMNRADFARWYDDFDASDARRA